MENGTRHADAMLKSGTKRHLRLVDDFVDDGCCGIPPSVTADADHDDDDGSDTVPKQRRSRLDDSQCETDRCPLRPSTPSRKLVLHFDVRNTILVSDSLTNDNVEQALNAFLAGVTWGYQRRNEQPGSSGDVTDGSAEDQRADGSGGEEDDSGEWTWCCDYPSLTAPFPGAITYYKSLERRLIRSPVDRFRLRKATGNFTEQPIGLKFRSYFDKHLRLLEWNCGDGTPGKANGAVVSPRSSVAATEDASEQTTTASNGYEVSSKPTNGGEFSPRIDRKSTNLQPEIIVPDVKPKLTIFGSNGRTYHYLMPSFIKMIYDLSSANRRFSIVLRTYGVDAKNVLATADHIVAGNHPQFPRSLPILVQRDPGRICRSSANRISCEIPLSWQAPSTTAGVVRLETPSSAISLETDEDIYRALSNSQGISGFVDDFSFWQNNDYDHHAGKPLWIDTADDLVQHIFFDDNIRVTDNDSIVDVRLFDDDFTCGSRQRSCRSLSLDEISSLENVCLVQADLLECTSDIDYFKRKVDECEGNYDEWLKAMSTRRSSGKQTGSNEVAAPDNGRHHVK